MKLILIGLLVRTSRFIQGKHLLFSIFAYHSLTLNQPSRSAEWLASARSSVLSV
ncbi:hypothetical protein T11_14109 [Trichinella zimbabwensis]|uniref:Uncharacterized protein n=1 Tax=Trichinella zimbabwensis TaxID=268475 RepID=A0A0V1GIY4_9BILA|nr:hypothetical protein T11_14109 [Trichinella zimbabwensis]